MLTHLSSWVTQTFPSADNRVAWNWTVVFIPAFIVDAFLLIILKPSTSATVTEDEDGNPVKTPVCRAITFNVAITFTLVFYIELLFKADENGLHPLLCRLSNPDCLTLGFYNHRQMGPGLYPLVGD